MNPTELRAWLVAWRNVMKRQGPETIGEFVERTRGTIARGRRRALACNDRGLLVQIAFIELATEAELGLPYMVADED